MPRLVVAALAALVISARAESAPAFDFDRLLAGPALVAGLDGFAVRRVADRSYCGGTRSDIVRLGKRAVPADDTTLAELLDVAPPTGLEFAPRPEHKDRQERSLARLNAFITAITIKAAAAMSHYRTARETAKDDLAKIAAAARLVQITRIAAAKLAGLEIPRDVRTGENAADKVAAFCDALAEKAMALADSADAAAQDCSNMPAHVVAGWNTVCVVSAKSWKP
jgi:hypothetical protein